MDNLAEKLNTLLFYSFFEDNFVTIFNDDELKDTNDIINTFDHFLSDETIDHNIISKHYKEVLEDILTTYTYQDFIPILKKQCHTGIEIPNHFITLFLEYVRDNNYCELDSNTIEIYIDYDEKLDISTITTVLNEYTPKKTNDDESYDTFHNLLWDHIEEYYFEYIDDSTNEIISTFLSQYIISPSYDCYNDLIIELNEVFNENYTYTLNTDQLLSNSLHNNPLILKSENTDCEYLEYINEFVKDTKPDLNRLTEKELICQTIKRLDGMVLEQDMHYYNQVYSAILTTLIHSQGYTLCDFYNEDIRNASKFLTSVYENIFKYDDVYPEDLHIEISVNMGNYEDLAEIYAYYNDHTYSKTHHSSYGITKDTHLELGDSYNTFYDKPIRLEKDIPLNYLRIEEVFISTLNQYNSKDISDTIYKD